MKAYEIIGGIKMVDCLNLFPTLDISKTRAQRFRVRGESLKGDLGGKDVSTEIGRYPEVIA